MLARWRGSQGLSELPRGPGSRLDLTDNTPPQGPARPAPAGRELPAGPDLSQGPGDPTTGFEEAGPLSGPHLSQGAFCPLHTVGTDAWMLWGSGHGHLHVQELLLGQTDGPTQLEGKPPSP